MAILSLRGRSALSPFRIAKLSDALAASRPSHRIGALSARYWHFVEVARPLSAAERSRLERVLAYGARDEPGEPDGEVLLVVPRPGTISPWSSKATDIAHNCGLAAVNRIERGVVWNVASADGGRLSAADRDALLPRIHDRMVEAVFDDPSDAGRLFAHYEPRPLAAVPLFARGRPAIDEANAALGLALAPDEIDYLESAFRSLGRDPTDVELMMFAQAS